MKALYLKAVHIVESAGAEALMLLFVRMALGHVFWVSARTKVDGFAISDTTYLLFAEEYRLPLIPSDMAAVMATTAEHLFSLLLLIGFTTRLSAFALFMMTMVIQIFVYPDAWWPQHSLWAGLALVLIVRGGGLFSIDHWLAKRA
ncbi:MAG: DoxX family protein [Sphingomonadaceae bacterium]